LGSGERLIKPSDSLFFAKNVKALQNQKKS